MQLYNVWQALPRAFYSKILYQDVDQNWRGIGLRYLLLVCFICSLPLLYTTHRIVEHLSNDLHILAMQLPIITIKEGEVSIDQPVPYTIKEPATNKVIAVIDTSKTAVLETEDKVFMLLSKNKLMIKIDDKTSKTYALSDIKNFSIDKTIVNNWVNILSIILFVSGYFFAIVAYFIPSLLVTLFYATIAKFFVRSKHVYKELCRLTAVALTPTLALITLLGLMNIVVPYCGIIYVILSLSYLTFAIEVNRSHK